MCKVANDLLGGDQLQYDMLSGSRIYDGCGKKVPSCSPSYTSMDKFAGFQATSQRCPADRAMHKSFRTLSRKHSWTGGLQMHSPQFEHHPFQEERASPLQASGSGRTLARDGTILATPKADLSQNGQERDPLLSKAINRLLFMVGVVRLRQDALRDKRRQPVAQDSGGNLLIRRQEFPEVALTGKDHVANDQQRPPVPEHLKRQVYRTRRPPILPHSHPLLSKRNYLHYDIGIDKMQPVSKQERLAGRSAAAANWEHRR